MYRFHLIAFTIIIGIFFNSQGLAENKKPNDYYNPLDIRFEIGLNSGYVENLLNDSTNIEDSYSVVNARAFLYPHSNIELSLYTNYNYYGKLYELSNSVVGVGGTFILAGNSSPLTLLLSVDFNGRSYRENYMEFDNNNFSLISSAGYKWGSIFIRSGLSIKTTAYRYSQTADRESYEFFAGTNVILPGSNSLDIEAGYSVMDFSFISDTVEFLFFPPFENWTYKDYHTKGSLNSFYISPRLSRPIGSKNGISFTFNLRRFSNGDDKVVIGSALNFISPWANIYEGQSYVLNFKTYMIPHAVLSVGAGYWKKTFLKTHIDDFIPVNESQKRYDEQNRLYVNLERPWPVGGSFLRPVLSFEYSHNNSSFNIYDYSGVTVSLGIMYKF